MVRKYKKSKEISLQCIYTADHLVRTACVHWNGGNLAVGDRHLRVVFVLVQFCDFVFVKLLQLC